MFYHDLLVITHSETVSDANVTAIVSNNGTKVIAFVFDFRLFRPENAIKRFNDDFMISNILWFSCWKVMFSNSMLGGVSVR